MANEKNTTNNSNVQFPPVVSVLGHVDHGKTSLLDRIRQSSIASGEVGGITQKIGASQIEITHDSKPRRITFIDTPGHEAFANMRSQGVNAADIVLLIVAADDGVMPQTKESIEKIREAKIPFIVVITKADVEGANIEKVKQQLLTENIQLEGYGGDVPYLAVSSKTGMNIQELLDLILLVYDLSGVEKNASAPLLSVVIDSKLDKKRGVVSSVVLKQGTLAAGEKVYIPGKEVGKVRALFNASGAGVKQAQPGEAVEILGMTEVVATGSLLSNKAVSVEQAKKEAADQNKPMNLAMLFQQRPAENVPIILKTETSGEMEAIKEALPEEVEVVSEGQGDIAVADVMMAKDLGALIVGFNVKISRDAQSLADTEAVFYRTYSIIYELLDELDEAIDMLKEQGKEKILGQASVLAKFQGTSGDILGMRVLEGRIRINDKVRIMRGDTPVGEAQISTMKRVKEDVKEATKGMECGATLSPSIDFLPGDVLLSHH